MKPVAILALLAAFGLGQAQTLFYGGDPDGRNGLISGSNLAGAGEGDTYDDFNLTTSATIGGLFGDWFVASAYTTASFTTARYDIRTGITDNGTNVTSFGTSVASGSMSVSATNTGLSAFGLSIFRITSGAITVPLAAGHYWLAVMPVGDGADSIFVTTTSGTAGLGTQPGIGSPLANGDSYFNAVSFYSGSPGQYRTDNASFGLGAGTWDFSYGITAAPAPEPASMAALGIGVLALIRRRRRRA